MIKESARWKWLLNSLTKKNNNNSLKLKKTSVSIRAERLKPFIEAMNTKADSFEDNWIRFSQLKVVSRLDRILNDKAYEVYIFYVEIRIYVIYC